MFVHPCFFFPPCVNDQERLAVLHATIPKRGMYPQQSGLVAGEPRGMNRGTQRTRFHCPGLRLHPDKSPDPDACARPEFHEPSDEVEDPERMRRALKTIGFRWVSFLSTSVIRTDSYLPYKLFSWSIQR